MHMPRYIAIAQLQTAILWTAAAEQLKKKWDENVGKYDEQIGNITE